MNELAKFAIEMDYDNLWALNEFVTNSADEEALAYLYDLNLWSAKFRSVTGFLYRKVMLHQRLIPRIKAGNCPMNPRWTIWTTSLSLAQQEPMELEPYHSLVIQRMLPPKAINCLNLGVLGESQELKELVYEYSISKRQSFLLRTDLCKLLAERRQVLVKPYKMTKDNYAFVWQKGQWQKF